MQSCSQYFHDLLDITELNCLVIDRDDRKKCGQLLHTLREQKESCDDHLEDYCIKGLPRPLNEALSPFIDRFPTSWADAESQFPTFMVASGSTSGLQERPVQYTGLEETLAVNTEAHSAVLIGGDTQLRQQELFGQQTAHSIDENTPLLGQRSDRSNKSPTSLRSAFPSRLRKRLHSEVRITDQEPTIIPPPLQLSHERSNQVEDAALDVVSAFALEQNAAGPLQDQATIQAEDDDRREDNENTPLLGHHSNETTAQFPANILLIANEGNENRSPEHIDRAIELEDDAASNDDISTIQHNQFSPRSHQQARNAKRAKPLPQTDKEMLSHLLKYAQIWFSCCGART